MRLQIVWRRTGPVTDVFTTHLSLSARPAKAIEGLHSNPDRILVQAQALHPPPEGGTVDSEHPGRFGTISAHGP